jgi:lactobin A/cerein 7B family class IIb bacteriocin
MQFSENIAALEELNVTELNAAELQQVEGGLVPLILCLAAFDAALWGYIYMK